MTRGRFGRVDHRLAVYGSLAPGRENHRLLAGLRGTWHPGHVRGHLERVGWGAALGYPALRPDATGPAVRVQVFVSPELPGYWAELDAFEGEGYERVVVPVELEAGGRIRANLYARG